jgi:hypothetical protein
MNEQLRLSDAERDEAARVLGEHYAQGRLTAEEHQERQDRLFAARTYADLPPIFHDLPGGSPLHPAPAAPPRRPTPRPPRGGAPSPRGVLRVGLFALLAIVVVTHAHVLLVIGLVWLLVALTRGRGRACGRGYSRRGWAA